MIGIPRRLQAAAADRPAGFDRYGGRAAENAFSSPSCGAARGYASGGETTMNLKLNLLFLVASSILGAAPLVCAGAPRQKDYLTALEADKIRDAETVNER